MEHDPDDSMVVLLKRSSSVLQNCVRLIGQSNAGRCGPETETVFLGKLQYVALVFSVRQSLSQRSMDSRMSESLWCHQPSLII